MLSREPKNDFDSGNYVALTNFIAGGDGKRQEILAQPEAICSCPSCTSNCGCPTPCRGCDDAMSACQIMCESDGKGFANNQSLFDNTKIMLSDAAGASSHAVLSSSDKSGNESAGWSNFWHWNWE